MTAWPFTRRPAQPPDAPAATEPSEAAAPEPSAVPPIPVVPRLGGNAEVEDIFIPGANRPPEPPAPPTP
ncbi:MAG: hypothetical protein IKQ15_03185, partial [Kiritimatiellae bacterium]|nr:hypothetical protein [Kiritimatiellia bacterium]